MFLEDIYPGAFLARPVHTRRQRLAVTQGGVQAAHVCLSPQTFITEEGLCVTCCTYSFQKHTLLPSCPPPSPLVLGNEDTKPFKTTSVQQRQDSTC